MNGPEDRPWPGADQPNRNFRKLIACLLGTDALKEGAGIAIFEEDLKEATPVNIWKNWDTNMIYIAPGEESESNAQ